jgi:hypothetical protein
MGPRIVSKMTSVCAVMVAGRGSGFCSVITLRLYVSERGNLSGAPIDAVTLTLKFLIERFSKTGITGPPSTITNKKGIGSFR